MSQVAIVPLTQIHPNTEALRQVNKESEKFLGLVASVRASGILNPIAVTRSKDENGLDIYTLCDGLHRFTAACQAGLTEIPVNILELDKAQLLEAQIMGNFHKVDTKPVDYSRAIVRILTINRTMTLTELASRLSVSPKFIQDRLSLVKIDNAETQKLINDGDMPLSNAYALAKLPTEEQTAEMVQRAITDDGQTFSATVASRLSEIRKAQAEGRKANPPLFAPVIKMRKLGEVQEALKSSSTLAKIISENNPQSIETAILIGMKWVLSCDAIGNAEQIAKHEERVRAAEEAKKKRDAERQAKAANQAQATGVVSV